MKLRTINLIPKANILFNQDAKVIARIPQFNLVTRIHTVVYELEIPYIPGLDSNGDPLPEMTRIVPLKTFEGLTMSTGEINAVIDFQNIDLNVAGTYWENIMTAFIEGFRLKLGMDGKFGLTANDWEIL